MRRYFNSINKFPIIDRPGILPEDQIGLAINKVLRQYISRLNFFACIVKSGHEVEALHQMRVTVRYLKSALSAIKPFIEKEEYRNLKNLLDIAGSISGKARDMDVFRIRYGLFIDDHFHDKSTNVFYAHLIMQCDKQRQSLNDYFESIDYKQVYKNINDFEYMDNVFPGRSIENHYSTSIRDFIKELIIKKYLKLVNYDEQIRNGEFTIIHRIRIETKKLRYSMEMFKELIADEGGEVLETIKLLQDRLGDLNDFNVEGKYITNYLEETGTGDKILEDFYQYITVEEKKREFFEFIRLWDVIILSEFKDQLLNRFVTN